MPKIKVHEKALAHLSRGLYRSPASALRELVSNAWDANAKIVRIDTNYPNFHLLSVEDDGDGFSKQEFESLMEGGIGNSDKRTEKSSLTGNRRIIGRYGIGMLGISQICGAFKIMSKTRDGNGFKARVRLYDLLKDKLDGMVVDVGDEEVDIGTYEIDNDFVPEEIDKGTYIIADEMHPTFTRSFQESLAYESFVEPPLGDWREILKIANNSWSLQELGDYWRLLWDLSASCPIPYLNDKALPERLIKAEQEVLLSCDFSLFLDGRKLFKPVYLHGNPGGYTCIRITEETKIYGKVLKYHGYLIVQEGLQLKPDELRGILIRIKNVAIGYYDASLLDYRSNEGPRSRWITGEIYVEEGLENALNVDRDSFNRFHPEFRHLQDHVHRILREEVFPKTYVKIKQRSSRREKEKNTSRLNQLGKIISENVSGNVQLRAGKTGGVVSASATPVVEISGEPSSRLEISLPPSEVMNTKKPYRQLASAILAIFEIALRAKTQEGQRKVFTRMLIQLLREW